MSNDSQTKKQIRPALKAIPARDFLSGTKKLLDILGYRSDRILELSGSVDEFIQEFQTENQNPQTEKEFRKHVQSVQLIFQVTSDEIASANQSTLRFEVDSFDKKQHQSFLFFAVELKEISYTRGQYAQLTREINKRLSQPTVVLFKTADHRLTLSFVHRREHKRDPRRDVLGHVSLIREIVPANPHRAHLDILTELSLAECAEWMDAKKRRHNFKGLLAAWSDKLNTEELNRRFYQELFAWFNRAVKEARFPTDQARTLPAEEHVIRLITRMLFVWFMKEKGLISKKLFVEEQIADLLKNYDPDSGDSYYRTVLQNLFFATLNTEIDKRGFSKVRNATHRNFSRYRYKREINDPDALLGLFSQTPFINGGLFDCLDSEEATSYGGWRIDCFSDVHYKKLSIPNRLFFDDDGLITLFNHYKFTVEENTPIEQEVALDPELLGKVFENLLAAYNPETRETARKQTGSYYTPRTVVEYMVDEALVAMLVEKTQPDDGNAARWQDRLRYLLDYEYAFDEADNPFEKAEAEGIVQAIAELKVLDPAVGSGAFPMGILHKLTLVLQRIDPENKCWQKLQKKRAKERADAAFETQDRRERDAELLEISETFERYSGNFGRKLYLIQNSIFGVDIQPVACQIAKLRFFISLAIEQETDETADNFGIKPLPNLETRFVAANTLIGLRLSEVRSLLQDDTVQQNRKQIEAIHEKYFLANNRSQKLRYIRQEEKCRKRLRQALESNAREWAEREQREIDRKMTQLPKERDRRQLRKQLWKDYKAREERLNSSLEDAHKIAHWNPYDQNVFADWFDAEYMFGVSSGFDVVIGNPPYISALEFTSIYGTEAREELKAIYDTAKGSYDIYVLFIEKGMNLICPGGVLSYITPNKYLSAKYAVALRNYILKNGLLEHIVDLSSIKIFQETSVYPIIRVVA